MGRIDRNVSRSLYSKLPASVYGKSLPISQENKKMQVTREVFHVFLLD